MKKTIYDYEKSVKLANFVRKMNYTGKLNNTAKHIYFSAMPELERRKTGFGLPTTATYREIAEYACISIPSIKTALEQLKPGLCEIILGEAIKNGGIATTFRRYSIEELKSRRTYTKLKNERPKLALALQEELDGRKFFYGNEEVCPHWNVGKTGRICSLNPNVQSDRSDIRRQNICFGLKEDEILFYIDYKQAEPTVIQHAMDYSFEFEPYDKLSDLLDISRSEAKERLNRLNYCSTDPVYILNQWTGKARDEFMPYARALKEFKDKLWAMGKPRGTTKRRFVKLLGESIIEAARGKKTHRGSVLCWFAQGTIAEIINRVSLDVIELEPDRGWRFIFPEHDAAYIIGKPEHKEELYRIFKRIPRKLGIKNMTCHINTYSNNR